MFSYIDSHLTITRSLSQTGPQPQHQVDGRLLRDAVVGQRPRPLQLLPREDQPLLVPWNV